MMVIGHDQRTEENGGQREYYYDRFNSNAERKEGPRSNAEMK